MNLLITLLLMPILALSEEFHCGWTNSGRPPLPPRVSPIYGGRDSGEHEYPWVTLIKPANGEAYAECGSVLISDSWLVTACHCVYEVTNIDVYVGNANIGDMEYIPGAYDFRVCHPDYKLGSFGYDIALIHLKAPIKFSNNVGPICLPNKTEEENNFDGENADVFGWGSADSDDGDILQVANFTLHLQSDCNDAHDAILCTSVPNGVGTCTGDSGGPLAHQRANGEYILIGVVDYGVGSCKHAAVNGYARVSYFMDWIRNETGIDFP